MADRLTDDRPSGRQHPARNRDWRKRHQPLHSLINARQEMFDNVYWHHTNRACMVMLLRAVQEAVVAGVVTPETLTDHDDASLLALMSDEHMPAPACRLTAALRDRRIHKRAVEVSARSRDLYERLGALYQPFSSS